MDLKQFLLLLAEQCDEHASDENASHQGRTDSSSAAQALKAVAANMDNVVIVVVAGDPD